MQTTFLENLDICFQLMESTDGCCFTFGIILQFFTIIIFVDTKCHNSFKMDFQYNGYIKTFLSCHHGDGGQGEE